MVKIIKIADRIHQNIFSLSAGNDLLHRIFCDTPIEAHFPRKVKKSVFMKAYSGKRTSVTVLIPLFTFSLTAHCRSLCSACPETDEKGRPPRQHPPSLSITADPRHPITGLALTASYFSFHKRLFYSIIVTAVICICNPEFVNNISPPGRYRRF